MPTLAPVNLESARDDDFELDIRVTTPDVQANENPDTSNTFSCTYWPTCAWLCTGICL